MKNISFYSLDYNVEFLEVTFILIGEFVEPTICCIGLLFSSLITKFLGYYCTWELLIISTVSNRRDIGTT